MRIALMSIVGEVRGVVSIFYTTKREKGVVLLQVGAV